jgi:hypothetical protein
MSQNSQISWNIFVHILQILIVLKNTRDLNYLTVFLGNLMFNYENAWDRLSEFQFQRQFHIICFNINGYSKTFNCNLFCVAVRETLRKELD